MTTRWYKEMAMAIRAERFMLMAARLEHEAWSELKSSGKFNTLLFCAGGKVEQMHIQARHDCRRYGLFQTIANIYFNGL